MRLQCVELLGKHYPVPEFFMDFYHISVLNNDRQYTYFVFHRMNLSRQS